MSAATAGCSIGPMSSRSPAPASSIPRRLRRRVSATSEWTTPPAPDPRPAIAQFSRDLEARGITLVVMPVPVKPGRPSRTCWPDAMPGTRRRGVRAPEPVVSSLDRRPPAGRHRRLRCRGRARGRRARPGRCIWRPTRTGGPRPWRSSPNGWPTSLLARVTLPAATDPGYRIERVEQRNTGDIARMLDLPPGSPRCFRRRASGCARVLLADGSPWRSSRDATCSCSATASATSTRSSPWAGARRRDSSSI